MHLKRFSLLLLFTVIALSSIKADNDKEKKFSISGYIRDGANGEELVGATVIVKEHGIGLSTNSYGYYTLSLPPGNYSLEFSFLGYTTIQKEVRLKDGSITLSVELMESQTILEEVVVRSEKPNANITRAEMSVARLDIKAIKRIPALMGEVDVIKAIQLLPGVQSTSEGSSGFSVRGGSMDQNLILLDEATVYNASHLMGFFSVFNNDAVKDVKLYKGDIPASSGGRLSSLLDVRMKEGNTKEYNATGGVGTISSRLTIEGPIGNENTSFIVSGRRTYADVFLIFAKEEALRKNQLFFYDLNLKVNHKVNDNNRLFLSAYSGRDIFKNEFAGFGFGNQTVTGRWNHLFGPKLFLNTSVIYSRYDYYLGGGAGEPSGFVWKSDMSDLNLKADFNYFLNSSNSIKFGFQSVYHTINPGFAKGEGDQAILGELKVPNSHMLEHGIYAQNEQNIVHNIVLKYGLRFSAMQNVGKGKVFIFNDDYESTGFAEYSRGEVFNSYANLEPRVGVNFILNENNSLKASYSRTVQYIQQASNSAAGTPLDIWFTASPNVKPQKSDQFAFGYFRNLWGNTVEASAEVYYKKIDNVVDFKDFANILLNEQLEGELRVGEAKAYGLELMAQFTKGKLNGWISYTYSRAFRQIEGVNNGKIYPAPYDKPHDISVVANYDIDDRFSFSTTWVYATGVPATFPAGKYEVMGTIIPFYTERNSYRYPDYHRLDIAFNYKPRRRSGQRWQGEWNLSIYNAYNRKNAWAINFVQEISNPNATYAEMTYLFSILPAITYNFKF